MRVACICNVPRHRAKSRVDIALVVCPSQNDFPGRTKHARLSMWPSVSSLNTPLAQPDHLADTEIGAQVVLDLLAGSRLVTVWH